MAAVFDLTPDRSHLPCLAPNYRPGTVALLNVLTRRHPRGRSRGIFNCRPVRGGASLSRHATSTALDWDPGNDSDPEGYALAQALVSRARQLGIQRIIWDGRIWEHASGWQAFRGSAGPHHDHLHIELTDEAAQALTMTSIVAVFGLTRPPRKEPDVPNPTDFVDVAIVKGGRVKLESQGGVHTEGRAKYRGSMMSPGMAQSLRGSSGRFVAIDGNPDADGYVVMDHHGATFHFTTHLWTTRLKKLER